ncbi:hypothetical protein ACFXKK_02440 [Streptomyces globisporus]
MDTRTAFILAAAAGVLQLVYGNRELAQALVAAAVVALLMDKFVRNE